MSSYQYSTYGPVHEAAIPQKASEYCDFLTFLGIAQNLNIDFLPITWQPALGSIGSGGTGKIHEAFLDKNTSFAFKRRVFQDSFDLEEFNSKILPSIVAEISILLTRSIQHCPNIVNIVGICWELHNESDHMFSRDKPIDLSSAAAVPVLVFEKSKHGDLYDFMTNGAGKSLGFDERLHFCIEIANAVSAMHSLDVIHGDIKPQNVLVFQTSTKVYTTRMTDFGYSTVKATENDVISVPLSLHWTAPEWHHRGFSPAQAKKMDMYSLGLILLWVLCYNRPCCAGPEPHVMMPEMPGDALQLVENKLRAVGLGRCTRLANLFRVCLNSDPAERLSEFSHLQEILMEQKVSSPVGTPLSLKGQYPEGTTEEELMATNTLACTVQDVRDVRWSGHVVEHAKRLYSMEDSFQLIHSMWQLYMGDYRVRIYIANCLIAAASCGDLEESHSPPSGNICIQAALCYLIGFGVTRNPQGSSEICSGRIFLESELTRQFRFMRQNGFLAHFSGSEDNFSNGIFRWALSDGTVQFIDRGESCGGPSGWATCQSELRAEILDACRAFGHENPIVLTLKENLAQHFIAVRQMNGAEIVQANVLKTTEKLLGASHRKTTASKAALGDIYRQQLRFQEALILQMEVEESCINDLHRNPLSYVNAESLALTCAKLGQLEESDELLERVINYYSIDHGPEHLKSLNSKMSLAQTCIDRGHHNRAKDIGNEILEILVRTQGSLHPLAISCLFTIATAHQNLGQLESAEMQFRSVLEKTKSVYGPENSHTVDVMSSIASIYFSQGRTLQAVELQEKVVRLTMFNHGDVSLKAHHEKEKLAEMHETLIHQCAEGSKQEAT